MPIGALNSEIFADMFGTAAMREVFGDDALLARCVEVEAALARAQAKLGIIPAEAAEAITHAENSLTSGHETLDLARLKGETETVGYPILPLVRQLAELTGAAGRYLHWGATTQDIMDTAVVLQIRNGLRLIEEDLTAVPSRRAGAQVSRHTDCRAHTSPACSAGDLRLQGRGLALRSRPPRRAAGPASSARAAGAIRRRLPAPWRR